MTTLVLVCQALWYRRSAIRLQACLHWPPSNMRQDWLVSYPPHVISPDWVWSDLESGRSGREHHGVPSSLKTRADLETSSDIPEVIPPVTRIAEHLIQFINAYKFSRLTIFIIGHSFSAAAGRAWEAASALCDLVSAVREKDAEVSKGLTWVIPAWENWIIWTKMVNSKYFPCVNVAVSLIFTQRLTLFFLLYSRNHLDDVILICRAGVLLAAQTTSGATDCIGKSYGGSDCRIWIAKILKDFLCLFDKKSPTEISSFSSFVQVHAVQFTSSLKCQSLIIAWLLDRHISQPDIVFDTLLMMKQESGNSQESSHSKKCFPDCISLNMVKS